MRFAHSLVAVVLFLSTFAGVSSVNAQQVPGPHPSYLHALSDLRYARAYLDHGRPGEAQSPWEHEAVGQIDEAIGEIKRAAIDDGKDLRDHPPIDANLYPADRFREAEKLLAKAHHDLDHAEDVQQARGLRDAALMHIDRAWHASQAALNHGVR